jgi:hypothetical protein
LLQPIVRQSGKWSFICYTIGMAIITGVSTINTFNFLKNTAVSSPFNSRVILRGLEKSARASGILHRDDSSRGENATSPEAPAENHRPSFFRIAHRSSGKNDLHKHARNRYLLIVNCLKRALVS